jgi:hypothetical protein
MPVDSTLTRLHVNTNKMGGISAEFDLFFKFWVSEDFPAASVVSGIFYNGLIFDNRDDATSKASLQLESKRSLNSFQEGNFWMTLVRRGSNRGPLCMFFPNALFAMQLGVYLLARTQFGEQNVVVYRANRFKSFSLVAVGFPLQHGGVHCVK